ncbi:hypothetical protein NDU88_002516 [Pleurodeles waltl]|uniref:Uncharacterized protein n=1 Tax=Pleurodeles waltl TaxID=8319 RepID=A0AAV7LFW8_PLEWA|nr:hypothetical protein NDU88_002516 [Pleurodeles waltl]
MLPGSAFSAVGGGGPRNSCTAGFSPGGVFRARCRGLRAAETGCHPAPDISFYRRPPCRRGGSATMPPRCGPRAPSALPAVTRKAAAGAAALVLGRAPSTLPTVVREAAAAVGVTARGGRTTMPPRCWSSGSLCAARRDKRSGSGSGRRGVGPRAGSLYTARRGKRSGSGRGSGNRSHSAWFPLGVACRSHPYADTMLLQAQDFVLEK